MRAARTHATILLTLSVFELACINVNLIQATADGGVHCDPSSLGACPLGYVCSALTATCRPATFDAGTDSPADRHQFDAAAEIGPDAALDAPDDRSSPTDADAGGNESTGACVMPVPACVPDTGKKCDPVCQTGCGCSEKCSANALGELTCNVPLATSARGLGESCDITSPNAASQTDNCAPGLVCLNDSCGARCYRFCKTDGDCPMSTCTRDAGGGVTVCDVQRVACDPIKNGQPTGCPADVEGCYVSSTLRDETFCDCPFMASGTNASCAISRDCFPGLACVGPIGSSVCRPVCSLAAGATDCGALSTCTSFNGSTKYGYCN